MKHMNMDIAGDPKLLSHYNCGAYDFYASEYLKHPIMKLVDDAIEQNKLPLTLPTSILLTKGFDPSPKYLYDLLEDLFMVQVAFEKWGEMIIKRW